MSGRWERWERIGPLLRKELRQVRRSRAALLSATLLPILLIVVTPAFQLVSIRQAPTDMLGRVPPGYSGPLAQELTDGTRLFVSFLLPLFLTLGALVVPSVAATYTVVAERERRSLDLLIALPVRVGDILLAKMLAMLVLAAGVVLPLVVLDAVVLLGLGMISPGYALLLMMVVGAALACSVAEGLVLALLARDFRTANNLNGLLLMPLILLTVVVLLTVSDPMRLPVLALMLIVGGGLAFIVALRWLTFERYLA